MHIKELFKDKTVFSFEVFPPKKTSPVEVIYDTLNELNDLRPDFISVTFGAGGSGFKDADTGMANTTPYVLITYGQPIKF